VNDGLDEFDLKLLDAIQRSNRLTAAQLAERVCLSPSAVQRRLHRLRERKVIEAEVAIVSPEALGQSLTAIVEVTLDRDRPKGRRRISASDSGGTVFVSAVLTMLVTESSWTRFDNSSMVA